MRWSIAKGGGGGGGGGDGEQLNIGGGGITPISVTAKEANNSAPSPTPISPLIVPGFVPEWMSQDEGSMIASIIPLFPE